MSRLLVLPILLLGGCCCCGFGGGGGSSSGDPFGVGEKIQEGTMEAIIEAGTGGQVDISTPGQTFKMETDEGTITTYMDGATPEGFPWTLPSGTKVVTATKLDPKDPADGGATWMVSYETTEDWKAVAAHWKAEATTKGFKVTSTNDALAAAFAEASAAGAGDMMPAGPPPTSDMMVFETTDPNKSGGVMVDGSQPGKTTVVLTVR